VPPSGCGLTGVTGDGGVTIRLSNKLLQEARDIL